MNRAATPEIVFVRGARAHICGTRKGNRYIDYHAAFAPHFLGHNDPLCNRSRKVKALEAGCASLFGSGTTEMEGRLAELICHPRAGGGDRATGQHRQRSHRTSHAAGARRNRTRSRHRHARRLQRLAQRCGLQPDDAARDGSARVSRRANIRSCPSAPVSPRRTARLVHAVNFNDLGFGGVRLPAPSRGGPDHGADPAKHRDREAPSRLPARVCVLSPTGYGFVLIFDEVKTGFRHALGGYSAISRRAPGSWRSTARRWPTAIPSRPLGGRKDLMDYFVHPDAGQTGTIGRDLQRPPCTGGCGHRHHRAAGGGRRCRLPPRGIVSAPRPSGGIHRHPGAPRAFKGTVARQGSAFCIYLMDQPAGGLARPGGSRHDFAARTTVSAGRSLIPRGVYFFPLATKQCSISAAHTAADIDDTLKAIEAALQADGGKPAR